MKYNSTKLLRIAEYCKKIRLKKDIPLEVIALDSGYTVYNILLFEKGGNNNAIILSSYLNIMTIKEKAEFCYSIGISRSEDDL